MIFSVPLPVYFQHEGSLICLDFKTPFLVNLVFIKKKCVALMKLCGPSITEFLLRYAGAQAIRFLLNTWDIHSIFYKHAVSENLGDGKRKYWEKKLGPRVRCVRNLCYSLFKVLG